MRRFLGYLASRLILWNKLTLRRPVGEQLTLGIRPSLIGLILERRRQKS